MKLNRDYFYCFGCGATGDATEFVSRLFGLSPHEAAQRIAADFGLHRMPTPIILSRPTTSIWAAASGAGDMWASSCWSGQWNYNNKEKTSVRAYKRTPAECARYGCTDVQMNLKFAYILKTAVRDCSLAAFSCKSFGRQCAVWEVRKILPIRDEWSGLADFLANMIEKYADVLEIENLPNPERFDRESQPENSENKSGGDIVNAEVA